MNAHALPRTGSSSLAGASPLRAGKRVTTPKTRRGAVLAEAKANKLKTYTVKPGDSVYAIAMKYKVRRSPARRAPRLPAGIMFLGWCSLDL